jgi:UDP-N-acetylenolpyruvoylglucosamine reductase
MATTAYTTETSDHQLDVRLVFPGDEDWDEARQAWNLAVDQHPWAVALPETADDVVELVRFARERGLQLAPQGTGHNAEPLGPLDDTILVKTHLMNGVSIDPAARIARAEAGVIWIDVVEPAAEHGLAALHGSSPDVGVVGYSLGGGMGWYARSHGLATNSVTSIELVTAEGELIRADADHHADVFWALRGGGGSFGIVTAIEFRLYPITEVYAGVLFFPLERASEILHAWRRWAEDVPDEVTSVGRLLRLPPIPDVPEPLRGRSFVIVEAAYTGEPETGAGLIQPLRELGPEIDTFDTVPATALTRLHMDPEHPVPGKGGGMLLADFTPDAIDALVAAAGPETASPLLSVEVRQLGGALGRSTPDHGALDRFDAGFVAFAVGIAMTPDMGHAVEAAVDEVRTALAPWDAGREYLNFAERQTAAERLFDTATLRRLREVKSRYDSGGLFRANHPVAA